MIYSSWRRNTEPKQNLLEKRRGRSVKNDFREITIPGDILEDENISDGAKIIYGKIARLSFKTGYCWASNKFLDGTETGRSASRYIQELINAGYIEVKDQQGKNRQIKICRVDSKINPAKSGEDESNLAKNCNNLAKNGDPTSPKIADNLAKSGEQTDQDITNINKQKKETEKDKETVFLPDDKPIERKEDATTVFNKAREFWNRCGLKPECRDIIIRPADVSDILRTFQHYTWKEIKNAIGNYAWHKKQSRSEYLDPPPYGSLYGFLKTGVERYFDDNALDQQFKKEAKD